MMATGIGKIIGLGTTLLLYASAAHAQTAPAEAAKASVLPSEKSGTAAVLPRSLFVVHLTTGSAWVKDKQPAQQAGFRQHSANLQRMRIENVLVMGARYKDSVADKGMLLLRAANIQAARAQFDADPMVRDDLFKLDIAEFHPFYDGFVARPEGASVAAGSEGNPLGRREPVMVTTRQPTAVDAMTWLAGCWSGSSGKMSFREHWMRPAGGMMMGMGRSTMEGKVASFEAMRIELDVDGTAVFVAKPSGQPEASFKMVKNDADGIVFENPTHDFPQRVRYQLKSDGSLFARIEGTKDGKVRGIDFPMRRASCE